MLAATSHNITVDMLHMFHNLLIELARKEFKPPIGTGDRVRHIDGVEGIIAAMVGDRAMLKVGGVECSVNVDSLTVLERATLKVGDFVEHIPTGLRNTVAMIPNEFSVELTNDPGLYGRWAIQIIARGGRHKGEINGT